MKTATSPSLRRLILAAATLIASLSSGQSRAAEALPRVVRVAAHHGIDGHVSQQLPRWEHDGLDPVVVGAELPGRFDEAVTPEGGTLPVFVTT